jgi:hypothetical protein
MHKFIVFVSCIVCLYVAYWLYEYEGYNYIKQETPIAESSVDDNSDCKAYTDFISKPVNIAYYTTPRFLNPRESCRDECVEGVWFEDHHLGAVRCCEGACSGIPE